MKKILYLPISLLFLPLFFPLNVSAAEVSLSFVPPSPLQGETILISLSLSDPNQVQTATFSSKPIQFFLYQGKASAFAATDLNSKPGEYKIKVLLKDGASFEKSVFIEARNSKKIDLGIPVKLGGNTKKAETALVSSLSKENQILNQVYQSKKAFWAEPFTFPLSDMVLTDGFGTVRQTGAYSITHRGSDFRAPKGTPVKSINRGVVRVAQTFSTYGKTVIVDHGFGLASIYVHLSKININAGQLVTPGQIIGLSGDTGYAVSPHLHFSLKLNGVSVDPVTFFELFNKRLVPVPAAI